MPRGAVTSWVLIALLVSACGKPASPSEALRARHLAELETIGNECGLPASSFELTGSDELRLHIAPDAKYESVDCALRKLKNSDLRLKGFVGNEAFQPEKSDVPAR